MRKLCLLLLVLLPGALPLRAQAPVVLYEERFDVAPPALPAGWAVSDAGWSTSTATASPGSGGASLEHRGAQPGQAATPWLDLRGATEATLRYLARRSGTYAPEQLRVTASADGGLSFPFELAAPGSALPAAESAWADFSIPLPGALLGQSRVVLRFEAAGGSTASSVLRIDDVQLVGTAPLLALIPDALHFGPVRLGETRAETLAVRNAGNAGLVVERIEVEGPGFGADAPDAFELAPGAARALAVRFTPAAAGSAAGRLLIHTADGGEPAAAPLSGDGVELLSALGFREAYGRAFEETDSLELPLRLTFSDPARGLQGVQFDVVSESPLVRLTGVAPGAAVREAEGWRLDYRVAGDTLRVLLLGDGAHPLSAGVYDPLLVLRAAVGRVESPPGDTVRLTLSGVVGALATPDGADAGFVADVSVHALDVALRRASFSITPEALDAGGVPVGQAASMELEVSNPGGARSLRIGPVVSSNDLFRIEPAEAEIAPGAALRFTVFFEPTPARFGEQSGVITFVHDGGGTGTAQIPVTGRGLYGRGDADGDGGVDVVDLVRSIDFVLGRAQPLPPARAAADRYPFPDGDGRLDVRDLTVLAQAIVRSEWPDGAAVPEPPAAAAKVLSPDVRAVLAGSSIRVEQARPLRALQIELRAEGLEGTPAVVAGAALPAGTLVLAHARPEREAIRVLVCRFDGGVLPAGAYEVATVRDAGAARIELASATGVDEAGRRVEVTVGVTDGTDRPGQPLPDVLEVGAPYPNPFSAPGESLWISVGVPRPGLLRARIFDVGGRLVARVAEQFYTPGRWLLEWDGRDDHGQPAASGVYFLRVDDGSAQAVRSFVLIR